MEKRLKHLSSEKRKVNLLPKRTKIRQTGRVSASEPSRPAVTAPLSPLALPPALFLEMRRETVMGMPPVPSVIKTENTDRAT